MIHILFFILFLVFILGHEYYRIKDEQYKAEGARDLHYKHYWHLFKGLVQAIVIMYATWNFYLEVNHVEKSIAFISTLLSTYWLIHDMFINKYVLNVHLLYVGFTDVVDKKLRRLFGKNVEATTFIIKVSFLIASICLIIFL